MIVQIFDPQTDGLAWTCASDRQRVGQQPELIVDAVGGSDKRAHLVVGEDDVSRFCAFGKLEARFPKRPGFEFACRVAPPVPVRRSGSDEAIDRGWRHGAEQAIAPVFNSVFVSSATGLLSSTLVRCSRGQSAL